MDAEFRRLLGDLSAAGYQGVVFGDIHLADVRAWYEERVLAAGLKHVEPIWGEAPADLLDEYVRAGGRAVVSCCDIERLDAGWLGRVTDANFLEDLTRLGIDACGENGEYHTFAFTGPPLARAVAWRPGNRESDGRFERLLLESG
jgi:diphthamide synthase (EF-2-diphthine--ammonia ligase)